MTAKTGVGECGVSEEAGGEALSGASEDSGAETV